MQIWKVVLLKTGKVSVIISVTMGIKADSRFSRLSAEILPPKISLSQTETSPTGSVRQATFTKGFSAQLSKTELLPGHIL